MTKHCMRTCLAPSSILILQRSSPRPQGRSFSSPPRPPSGTHPDSTLTPFRRCSSHSSLAKPPPVAGSGLALAAGPCRPLAYTSTRQRRTSEQACLDTSDSSYIRAPAAPGGHGGFRPIVTCGGHPICRRSEARSLGPRRNCDKCTHTANQLSSFPPLSSKRKSTLDAKYIPACEVPSVMPVPPTGVPKPRKPRPSRARGLRTTTGW